MDIVLRTWSSGDRKALMELCNGVNHDYLSDRIPIPYKEADADWWLSMVDGNEGKAGLYRAIVADGKVVGSISVEQKSDVYRINGEIGYMLLTDYWSQGIATMAVSQIIEPAFRQLDLQRIYALVFECNIGSARVLEKNGFELEGRLRNAVIKNGVVHNALCYGLTRQSH